MTVGHRSAAFAGGGSRFRRCVAALLGRAAPEFVRAYRCGRYAIESLVPAPIACEHPRVPKSYIGHDGIDMRPDEQVALLASWARRGYAEFWQRLRRNRRINQQAMRTTGGHAAPIRNGYYHTPDAEIYAAMIADVRPSLIVEVGGGYSTLIAREAMSCFGVDGRLVVIDPEPRTAVEDAADVLLRKRVEQLEIDEIEWSDDSILFIDSSHVCRARGDVTFLYCRLIPRLSHRVVVHVHDVYLPWDYPPIYDEWVRSEQYVLHSLLSHSARYEVLFATYYMSRSRLSLMRETFGESVGIEQGTSGASFWFRVRRPSGLNPAALAVQ